jgi:phenylalanyl-tRNA synthetase alpha chain
MIDNSIIDDLKSEINKIDNKQDFQNLKASYLGKKGKVKDLMKEISKIEPEKRKEYGQEVNKVKNVIENIFEEKMEEINKIEKQKKEKKNWIDVTLPGAIKNRGKEHLIEKTARELIEIFTNHGFKQVEGPEIEKAWYNFDALNTPEWHPAREMQDTFYMDSDIGTLLRTHTSPVQVRTMLEEKPPLAIISPGRVFRKDEMDATHLFAFNQLEALYIDKNVSVANLKYYLESFTRSFFGNNVDILLRPSYFPFTEPSFEVDLTCIACGGKGCNVCGNTGWIEVLGAGLVNPNVIKNVGLNPDEWQGFALGAGIERFAMLKYNINDIREFVKNDIRFID